MSPETERKSIWVVMETGKCVCSAVGVINSDMSGSGWKEKVRRREAYNYRGKQIVWLIRKSVMDMDGEWAWGVYSLLVSVLLDSTVPIYLLVVDMFYLVTSETLRQYNSLL